MQLEPLKSGDIVDIIAPASKCSSEDLKKGMALMVELGLNPRRPEDLFAKSRLFSNHEDVRLKHLRRAFYSEDSKLIWCVRGGYGCLGLMREVKTWKRPLKNKIFLGYSDITTLHVHLHQKWNWSTLHGPMVGVFGRGELNARETKELLSLLFGLQVTTEFDRLNPLNGLARKRRVIRAPIRGGNMVVLQSSLGTPSEFKPKGCLLFFEETNEKPYRVDRMLEQFTQAGWFDQCQGVLFGDMLVQSALEQRILWQDVIPRFVSRVKIPVLKGLPVGHKAGGHQRTLPLNTESILTLGPQPKLEVQSGIRPRIA